ncbi:hypothetical protein [Halosimplex marinum]|uniref:hypothetical protein n=1 Tax=Halosimplex marinum TaxID=3396620 RepID=UPI003F57A31F
MLVRLLKLLFRLAGVVFSIVFVVGMLEFFGLTLYMLWRNEAALDALTAGGVTPGELIAFLLASPDRLVVAAVLAVLGLLMVFTGDSGGSHGDGHVHDGFGGMGDGGGSGGGGDGGGGGGE